MKKIFPLFAAGSLCLALTLSACAPSIDLLPENIIDDDYDNYYEIFVGSFCDSDGDGRGDFNGVTQKLSYIRDMGYTGIWLMPICSSPSYHKYDVADYYAVDETYGTMEDFENLVGEAHALGIKVIIDMVFNHSSRKNEWFKQFLVARADNDESNKYYDYYNYSSSPIDGYAVAGSGDRTVYYEARFDASMPDLNLDNEDLKEDLKAIMRFWLVDKEVDGFRFDAVRYFYYGDSEKSSDFMGKLKQWADEILEKEKGEGAHAYFVGEDWSTEGEISKFYEKGNGSTFFAFNVAQSDPSYIFDAISSASNPAIPGADYAANVFYRSMGRLAEIAHGGISVPFLDNHDTTRVASTFRNRTDKIKFAYGLLSMYSGNTFTYYGDELGVEGVKDDGDETLRVGMLWEDNTELLTPYASMGKDASAYYHYGSVQKQLSDPNSILNYYKLCNNARNAFPALMRGTAERLENANENVLVLKKTYRDESITVVINFSTEEQTVQSVAGTLRQSICVSGSIEESGFALTMPGFSIAILL